MENLLDPPDMMGNAFTYKTPHPIQHISLSHSHTGDNVSCHQPCQEPVIHIKEIINILLLLFGKTLDFFSNSDE